MDPIKYRDRCNRKYVPQTVSVYIADMGKVKRAEIIFFPTCIWLYIDLSYKQIIWNLIKEQDPWNVIPVQLQNNI